MISGNGWWFILLVYFRFERDANHKWYIYIIYLYRVPVSSRYVKFLPFGRFLFAKRYNFYTLGTHIKKKTYQYNIHNIHPFLNSFPETLRKSNNLKKLPKWAPLWGLIQREVGNSLVSFGQGPGFALVWIRFWKWFQSSGGVPAKKKASFFFAGRFRKALNQAPQSKRSAQRRFCSPRTANHIAMDSMLIDLFCQD